MNFVLLLRDLLHPSQQFFQFFVGVVGVHVQDFVVGRREGNIDIGSVAHLLFQCRRQAPEIGTPAEDKLQEIIDQFRGRAFSGSVFHTPMIKRVGANYGVVQGLSRRNVYIEEMSEKGDRVRPLFPGILDDQPLSVGIQSTKSSIRPRLIKV